MKQGRGQRWLCRMSYYRWVGGRILSEKGILGLGLGTKGLKSCKKDIEKG